MKSCLLFFSMLLVIFSVTGKNAEIYADYKNMENSTTVSSIEELSPKTKLSRLIYKCRFLKEEKYTEVSWKVFSVKLSTAEQVFTDDTSDNQDYEQSYHELRLAKENLQTRKKDYVMKLIIWGTGGSIVLFLPFVIYGMLQYKTKNKF